MMTFSQWWFKGGCKLVCQAGAKDGWKGAGEVGYIAGLLASALDGPALAAAPQAEAAQGASTGFKLVPIEPTEAMLTAGRCVKGLNRKYAAMVAAAPSPDREQMGERWCFKCGHNAHEGSCADASPSRECGEQQECPHGVDDGACKQCYGEAVSGEQRVASSDEEDVQVEHEALRGEAERIAANLYKTGHYLAAPEQQPSTASAPTPTAPTQELAQNVLTESWVRRAQAAVNAVVGEKDEETLLKLAGRMEQLLREALEAAPAQREPVACDVCEPGECAAVDCGYPCITDQQRSNWAFLVNCWDEAQHGSPARAGAGAMAIDALRRLLAALQAAPVVAQPQVAEPKGLKEIAASFVDWELVERMRSAEEIDSEEAGMLGAMIDSQAREIEALRAILSKGA